MERTVQVLAARCVLKRCSDITASPGTMLAPALSADREQLQQHSVMHTTAASVGQ